MSNLPIKLAKSRASAQRFYNAVADMKSKSDHGSGLDLYPVSEYEQMDLYLTHGNDAGFAITKEKELICLFKQTSVVNIKGWQIAREAGYEGARTLNCFDGFLVEMYRKAGWVVSYTLPFCDDLAPDDWDYDRDGRPDVVFMTNLFHELDTNNG